MIYKKQPFTGTAAGDKQGYLDDVRLWIESLALDIHSGGNQYSLKWINEYFSDTTTLNYSRASAELLFIVEKAKDLCLAAITNQLTGVFSATNSSDEATYYADLSITADPSPGSPYATQAAIQITLLLIIVATCSLQLLLSGHGKTKQ